MYIHKDIFKYLQVDPLQSTSTVRYDILGDERRFMILMAQAENRHTFTPYYENGGRVATYMK